MTDRDLVRLHWPAEVRPAFDALFAIDDALADVVARAREPALAAIKLAWWREQLEALDSAPPPAEPRLRAAAAELLPRGIRGHELAALEQGWAALLQPEIDQGLVTAHGVLLFDGLARALGVPPPGRDYGLLFGLMDAARRGFPMSLDVASTLAGSTRSQTSPKSLRALTALSALAARDADRGAPFEPEATPGRALTILRHRLTGR